MMRVTGGTLRSRRVHAPRGRAIRPTPGRVREALFSILGARIGGARILDLFAGTGAVGIEALSRGAERVTFYEAHRPTAARIEAALRELDVADRAEVVAMPADRAARVRNGRYDIVFADPPYAQGFPDAVFTRLVEGGCIDGETLVVYEHPGRAQPPRSERLRATRTERYGDVALTFMRLDVQDER